MFFERRAEKKNATTEEIGSVQELKWPKAEVNFQEPKKNTVYVIYHLESLQ